MEQAKRAGELLAERAKAAGVETCVFDRGGYRYHGRVKALAEGAREGGLKLLMTATVSDRCHEGHGHDRCRDGEPARASTCRSG